VRSKRGLGIISMQERVRLAHGGIAVRSRPGIGARIAVRIPIGETGDRATSTPASGR
jgi:signal transduction histidine kinase